MLNSQTLLSLALAGLASAAPLASRDAAASTGPTDGDILNYALTLEHLEDTFYRDGLAKFSEKDFADAGFDATVYKNIKIVSSDEETHVSFLTTALTGTALLHSQHASSHPVVLTTSLPHVAAKVTPVKACTYNFAYTDVKTFLATASVLEGVGVSAYLGAAADIMNKDYLTAAGSILTVEARHSSYIRSKNGQVPFAQPFDAPLSLDEVYSLASQFIVSCPPENPKLPVKAFPVLTLDPKTPTPVKTGDTVTVLTPVSSQFMCFITRYAGTLLTFRLSTTELRDRHRGRQDLRCLHRCHRPYLRRGYSCQRRLLLQDPRWLRRTDLRRPYWLRERGH